MQLVMRAGVLLICAGAALLSGRDALLAYWTSRYAEALETGHTAPNLSNWALRSPRVQMVIDQQALWKDTLPDAALPRVAANARAVLLREPLEPTALYQLGMVAERRIAGAGQPLFALVERLSRREVPNELELEGMAVQRGDNAGAIQHVDRAVLYVPEMGERIFPALVPAIADPEILKIFTHYADRPWYPVFIYKAMGNGADPDAVATLIRAGTGHLAPALIDELNTTLIGVLLNAHNIGAIRRITASLAPDIRKGLAEMGFSHASTNPRLVPLSWKIGGDDAISARLDDSGGLAVTAAPEQSGMAASRLTLLAPGTYEFVQTIVHDSATPRAGIVWDVVCAGQANQIWHQPINVAATGRTTTHATVTVPAGCDGQLWRLQVVGADGDQPSTVTIANLALQSR